MSKKPTPTQIEKAVAGALDKLEAFNQRQRNRFKDKPVDGIYYASFNDRVFATVIDIAISFVLVAPIMMGIANLIYGNQRENPLAGMQGNPTIGEMLQHLQTTGFLHNLMLDYMLNFIVFGALIIWLWHVSAATPGKWLLRMRVVDAQTFCKPSPAQCVKRYCGYVLSSLPLTLGFAWVMIDKRRRGWHDILADTVVVKVKHWRFKDDGVTPHIILPDLPEANIKKDEA